MKVLALALALCFAVAPLQAAAKNKGKHHSAKSGKKGHYKGANKASRIKRANSKKVN